MVWPVIRFLGRTALGGCIAFTFIDRVGHPALIAGSSMCPTLEGSDARWWKRDMVWLTAWGTRKPNIGDIITFTSPRDPTKIHIKRVTANEGDLVRPKGHEMMLVPAGCCWMESDNAHNANDSNIYGPVSRGLIKKRATHIIWPPNRWHKL